MRQHCEKPTACDAVTPGKHCRRCCNRALHANAEVQARRIAAARAANQKPEFRAARREQSLARYADPAERARTGEAVRAALRTDPAKRERHAAAARRNGLQFSDPEKLQEARRAWIAAMSPEERRRHFGRRGFKAGLNGDDLALYVKLNKSGIPCAQAREMVDDLARKRVRQIAEDMERRAAREKAMAY